MSKFSPDVLRILVDGYKVSCAGHGQRGDDDYTPPAMPSPPGLTLAIGLTSKAEFDAMHQDPLLKPVIDSALLWMASQWYELLQLPAKEVNASSVIFALKTMGYSDNSKIVKSKESLTLRFHAGHDRL